MNPCGVCKKVDTQKPMCFRGEPYCSENHRKQLVGELIVVLVDDKKDKH